MSSLSPAPRNFMTRSGSRRGVEGFADDEEYWRYFEEDASPPRRCPGREVVVNLRGAGPGARRDAHNGAWLTALAFCAALTWPSLASAQAAQVPDAAAVRVMLSGFEEGPSRADWRALGEAVLPSLAQVASDRSAESFLRERAVSAAAAFSTPAARTLMTRALRDRHAMVVRAAILGLADAFGESALGSVTPFLTHSDTALREAAIRALASIDSSASTRALLGARARESDEVLREQIDAALQARGARAG